MDYDDKVPQDGEVYALSSIENNTRAEFVDTNGKIAWRLYDRFGRGVLLLEEEIRLLTKLSTAVLERKDNEEK